MSDHEELESNVAAWVLGALDPEEAAVVRAHVEGLRLLPRDGSSPAAGGDSVCHLWLRRSFRLPACAIASLPRPPRPRAASTSAPSRVRKTVKPRRRGAGCSRCCSTACPFTPRRLRIVVALVAGLVAGDLLAGSGRPGAMPPSRGRCAVHPERPRVAGRGEGNRHATCKADGLALVDFSGLPAVGQGRVYEGLADHLRRARRPGSSLRPRQPTARKVVLVNRALQGYTLDGDHRRSRAQTGRSDSDSEASAVRQRGLSEIARSQRRSRCR